MSVQRKKKEPYKPTLTTLSKSQDYLAKREHEMHVKVQEFFDEVRREIRQPLAELDIAHEAISLLQIEVASLKKDLKAAEKTAAKKVKR